MKSLQSIAVSLLALASLISSAAAKNGQPNPTPAPPAPSGPPAPVLIAPAAGASLVQPITLDWNATSSANGQIGSYTWQVGTTSTFTTTIAAGFTNMDGISSVPTQTSAKVSGLPNGTYFWRVKATQLTTNGGVDSAWSAVQTFTVTGLGGAPGTPTLSAPGNNAQFHTFEFYDLQWSAVPNAHYYLLEADDDPAFSYPLSLSDHPMTFGTRANNGFGNPIPNIYYRVRAVSVDGVRGLPSATVVVHITDAAPVPPAVSQVSPAAGATVALPFFLDWTDTPNPQVPGYLVEVNPSSSFTNINQSLLLGPTRSDYMVTSDLIPPGNYFWRVRAAHGNVYGPWSAPRAITITAGPTPPPNVGLFGILAEGINAYSGNSVRARVVLDNPAPAGGALVTIASDIPQAQMPFSSITVPAGKTDAIVSPITTGPVPSSAGSVGILGNLRAAYANGWQQQSLGVLSDLFGLELSNENVVGGTSFTGTVTLQSAAPPGGYTVRLVSGDTSLVRPPPTVFIPAGGTEANFTIATSPVTEPTRVTLDPGTEADNGVHQFQVSVVVTPPGSPAPPPSLSSLTLNSSSILAGATVTGTVTLTSPAPAGGASVFLNGSLDGQVITPPSVIVPAGSTTATFTTTPAPQVNVPSWVFIQARYGQTYGLQVRILEIDPAPGVPTLLAIGPSSQDLIGGNAGRGSVGIVMPAPVGGATVNLSTDNPAYIHVPATVTIPAGNSAVSFPIATSPVATFPTGGGHVTATAGGISKSIFVNVAPDPNAPPILQGVTISPASVTGGSSATGTVLLNSPAPAGGIEATMSTSNIIAKPQSVVTVPAGQTSANFTITTSAVTANTVISITAAVGNTSKSGSFTVTKGAAPAPTPTPAPTAPPSTLPAPSLLSPAADARFTPGANIAFDWSDVSGAASYTIQVANSSSFSGALTLNQTVTASQFSTSTLPTQTLWWRVRANDASGNGGTFTAARRLEVKK